MDFCHQTMKVKAFEELIETKINQQFCTLTAYQNGQWPGCIPDQSKLPGRLRASKERPMLQMLPCRSCNRKETSETKEYRVSKREKFENKLRGQILVETEKKKQERESLVVKTLKGSEKNKRVCKIHSGQERKITGSEVSKKRWVYIRLSMQVEG